MTRAVCVPGRFRGAAVVIVVFAAGPTLVATFHVSAIKPEARRSAAPLKRSPLDTMDSV